MPKKPPSTIENRVYVFTPLAQELVRTLGVSALKDGRALRGALAELARVACVVADSEGLSPEEVEARVLGTAKKKR